MKPIMREMERGRILGNWPIWAALANTLPDKDLFSQMNNDNLSYYEKKYLYSIVEKRNRQHKYALFLNQFVDQAIAELESPKCRQKTALREKLIYYFPKATKQDQHKILHVMLHQSKKDRAWALVRLKQQWSPEFEQEILDLFDQSADEECAKVILYHCSEEAIYQRCEELSVFVGCAWITERLWDTRMKPWYPDDLTPSEEIRVIKNLKLSAYYKDLEKILYQGIAAEVEYLLTQGDENDLYRRLVFHERQYINHKWLYRDNERNLFFFEQWIHNVEKDETCWQRHVPGAYLLDYFKVYRYSFEEVGCKVLNLFSFPRVDHIIAVMGELGLADAILRFVNLDKALPCQVNDDKQMLAKSVFNWLYGFYTQINIRMFGCPELDEKYTKLETWGELANNKKINYQTVEGLLYTNPDLKSFLDTLELDQTKVGVEKSANTYEDEENDDFYSSSEHIEDLPF